jgi:hypothetical protein
MTEKIAIVKCNCLMIKFYKYDNYHRRVRPLAEGDRPSRVDVKPPQPTMRKEIRADLDLIYKSLRQNGLINDKN